MVADAKAIEQSAAFTPVLAEERRDFRGSFSGYERDQLFYNPDGAQGSFIKSGYVFGLDYDHDGRAAAPVDIDGDGDLDLALLTLRGLRLLENYTDEESSTTQHYARVQLVGTGPNRHAVGAVVTLSAGGVTHRDYVKITEGFQTQVPFDLHFGLGGADVVEKLTVEWPSGAREEWTNLPVDRRLIVEEGTVNVSVQSLRRWAEGTRPRPIGLPSTTVEAPRLDGDSMPLAGVLPAVINFWAPWCAPCNVELPQLVNLATRYGDEISFVGVSVEVEDLESIRRTVSKFNIPYSQYLANEHVMERFFGTEVEVALPSTYVFDQNGRLRRLFRGPITESALDVLLQSFRDEGVFEADLELAARSALRSRDYETAFTHYRRLADLRPASAQTLYQLGVAALQLGNLEEALLALEQVVNRAPTHAVARFTLGVAQMRSGLVGEAFASFRVSLDVAGDNLSLLRTLGTEALDAGQLWLAVDALTRAVELDARSALTWLAKARAHRARGEQERAREAYSRALALDAGNEVVRRELDSLTSVR